jgi:hypothetical protein
MTFPDTLKEGNFVAVCPHIDIEKDEVPHWGPGGDGISEDGKRETIFHLSAMCDECKAAIDRPIECFRAKFFGGKLHFGFWEFVPTRNPGRPKKKKAGEQ